MQHYGAHPGLCVISKDELKEILFDTLGAGDAAWSRRLSDASFALMFAQVPKLLRPATLLLLEGNFRPGEHEPLLQRALGVLKASKAPRDAHSPGLHVSVAQVLLCASTATRAARLAARAADPQRHAAHRDALRDARQDERPLAAAFLDLPGPRLSFDSEADPQSALAALYAQLDAWSGCDPCEPCTSGPPAA